MKYIVSYDIADPKRLYRIAKELNKNGFRVQKSFFSCDLDQNEFVKMKAILLSHLDEKVDKLAIYKLCEKCASDGTYIGCTITQFFESSYWVL